MPSSIRTRKLLQSLSVAVWLVSLAGCSLLRPEPAQQSVIIEPELPPVVSLPEPEVPDHPPIVVVPRPEPEPAAPLVFSQRVAIVLSGRQAAYESVAEELERVLEDYSLYDLSDRSQTVRGVFRSIADEDATAVVAIGLRAALSARALSDLPVVFCQVFNVTENDLITDRMRGVSSIPPLSLQLRAWKELDPELKNVGAIIGEGHDTIIEEAQSAAAELGIQVRFRVAGSDKETLYIFNRLVPEIDGFMLFPDNRILSRTVLDQMLAYAARHRVQMAVFNESLLPMGATLSATPVNSDIAATIVAILDRFEKKQFDRLPAISPLSEIQIRTNQEAVQQLGIDEGGVLPDSIAGAL